MAEEKPVLKRFANLDIDGVDTPKRVRKKRTSPAPATTQQRSTSALTTGRMRRTQTAPRQQPASTPPGQPYRETVTASPRRVAGPAQRRAQGPIPGQSSRPAQRPAYRPVDPADLPRGGRGVMTIEMDLRQPRQEAAYESIPMTPGAMPEPEFLASLPMRLAAAAATEPARDQRPTTGSARRVTHRARVPASARPVVRDSPNAPVTITELAARQLRLVAHQAGMADAALRLLTAGPGGASQCEFALETDPPGADDVVFLSQGIRIIVDGQSLPSLQGTRITCSDLMI